MEIGTLRGQVGLNMDRSWQHASSNCPGMIKTQFATARLRHNHGCWSPITGDEIDIDHSSPPMPVMGGRQNWTQCHIRKTLGLASGVKQQVDRVVGVGTPRTWHVAEFGLEGLNLVGVVGEVLRSGDAKNRAVFCRWVSSCGDKSSVIGGVVHEAICR